MKKVNFKIEKRDISEYPTTSQKFVKGSKLLVKFGAGITSLVIIGGIFSAINNALDSRREKALKEEGTRIVQAEFDRWSEVRNQCGIEEFVSKTPIDQKFILSLDVEVPFSSLRLWEGSNYESQVQCFSKKIYGLSLTDKYKFGERLIQLPKDVYFDSKFNQSDGSTDSSSLWAVITSSSINRWASRNKDVLIVSFMWSQS